jgi:elongation factor Tu
MVLPGDNAAFAAEPMKPVAIEEERRFAIREGSRTVGAGIVTRLLA